MGSRGRKSAAAMSVPAVGAEVVPLKFAGPKRPNVTLTPRQAVVWRSVMDSPISELIEPEAYPLLYEYCRVSEQAERVAEIVNSMTDEQLVSDGGAARLDRYLAWQERISRTLSNLAVKLRIAPSARTHKDHAATVAAKPRGAKPWEG